MMDDRLIGRQYSPVAYEVGQEKIKEYASAVGEPNPLYLNQELGRSSKYRGIIAPPMFACVCFMPIFNALLQDREVFPDPNKGLHGEQEFEFFEVIRPGDIITTTGKIANVYSRKGMDFVVLEMVLTNQQGQKVAICRSTLIG